MTGDPRLWVAIEVLLLVGCVLFYRWEAQHTAPDERVGLAEDADVEVVAQAAERLNVDPLSHGRLGPDQHPQLVFQRIRQRLEKVVRSTLEPGWARARWTARCSATIVMPVPAEPKTRAGPP